MMALIDEHRSEIEAACRQFHVRRLELFGSAATGAFDAAHSDVDFLVEFERDPAITAYDQYFGLWQALKRILQREVDLVELGALKNPVFIRRVNESRVEVYAA